MIRLALPLIALAGCTAAETPPQPITPTACGAEQVRHLIGKQRSEAISDEVKRLSGAPRIRWIAPGQAVTMDYSETRLNIHVDARGKIVDARCG